MERMKVPESKVVREACRSFHALVISVGFCVPRAHVYVGVAIILHTVVRGNAAMSRGNSADISSLHDVVGVWDDICLSVLNHFRSSFCS